jgi:putative ABC transport system substrate-binding protein
MNRRQFITLLGGAAAAWPLAVRAQGVPRLGLLMNGSPTEPMTWSYLTAFQTALGDFGSVDGRDLHIDHRLLERRNEHGPTPLVALAPDPIVAASTTNLVARQRENRAIATVFVQVLRPAA